MKSSKHLGKVGVGSQKMKQHNSLPNNDGSWMCELMWLMRIFLVSFQLLNNTKKAGYLFSRKLTRSDILGMDEH